jgi:hypothetical protein
METAYDGTNNTAGEVRELRAGGFRSGNFYLVASYSGNTDPSETAYGFGLGFRVASVPEPSSLSLLALGGVVMALRRRR